MLLTRRVVVNENTYRLRRFVNYNKYTMFISAIAHDQKRLGNQEFMKVYSCANYRGLYKRYLRALIEHLRNVESNTSVELVPCRSAIVLDVYAHLMYFKYKNKEALDSSFASAVPEFLNNGVLLTEIQEAVYSSDK